MAVTGQKTAEAFKNIREVSEDLDVPQHVLRFWESKFSEIRPLKRGGRRRYYRPEDVALLRTIRDLLYVQGYKIRGVQRLLREGKVTTVNSVVTVAPADELEREGLGPDRVALEAEIGDDDEDFADQLPPAPQHIPYTGSINPSSEGDNLWENSQVQSRLMQARANILRSMQLADDILAA